MKSLVSLEIDAVLNIESNDNNQYIIYVNREEKCYNLMTNVLTLIRKWVDMIESIWLDNKDDDHVKMSEVNVEVIL